MPTDGETNKVLQFYYKDDDGEWHEVKGIKEVYICYDTEEVIALNQYMEKRLREVGFQQYWRYRYDPAVFATSVDFGSGVVWYDNGDVVVAAIFEDDWDETRYYLREDLLDAADR